MVFAFKEGRHLRGFCDGARPLGTPYIVRHAVIEGPSLPGIIALRRGGFSHDPFVLPVELGRGGWSGSFLPP
jgi:hypothetical protein